eukprot:SAG31_NODE_18071_length_647_cov_44.620438_1_plen_60_part_01
MRPGRFIFFIFFYGGGSGGWVWVWGGWWGLPGSRGHHPVSPHFFKNGGLRGGGGSRGPTH